MHLLAKNAGITVTELQKRILVALAEWREKRGAFLGMTCNELGRAAGYWRGQDDGKHSHNGRAMAVAQRVIFPITDLKRRGLVRHADRRDGLSGTAYGITVRGLAVLKEI